jgi:hypothetical protein
MAKKPLQSEPAENHPEEKESSWLWKILKFKYFWIAVLLATVLIIFWLNFNRLAGLVVHEKIKDLMLDYWIFIFTFWLIILTLVIWLVPVWQVKSLKDKKGGKDQSEFDLEKERIKLRDDTRKTMAQIIGGAFFMLGLFVTYNTFELNRQGQETSKKSQVSERFSKAIELTGNADMSVRIGGLYALEQIVRDYPAEYQTTVMQILAAYIREKSKAQKETFLSTKYPNEQKTRITSPRARQFGSWTIVRSGYKLTTEEQNIIQHDSEANNQQANPDIQIAIGIIRERDKEFDRENFIFDLREANLNHTDLSGIVIRNAYIGQANVSSSILSKIDLSNSDLEDSNFTSSKLIEANLTGAYLNNTRFTDAQLQNANLTNAYLGFTMFDGANLTGVNFTGARFFNADLRGATLGNNTGLEFEQLNNALIDEKTVLPQEFESRRTELLFKNKQIK